MNIDDIFIFQQTVAILLPSTDKCIRYSKNNQFPMTYKCIYIMKMNRSFGWKQQNPEERRNRNLYIPRRSGRSIIVTKKQLYEYKYEYEKQSRGIYVKKKLFPYVRTYLIII